MNIYKLSLQELSSVNGGTKVELLGTPATNQSSSVPLSNGDEAGAQKGLVSGKNMDSPPLTYPPI